ncbi:hypothetical protein [Paenibacillus lutimineralis]|uniref:Uncharacterized protein n=1 Tax=Paenibacillus lutimineralis TaxID=2707005 RepID=A0A3Q9IC08_9BACL|nr:hypothetical protein [Paenibacillus lutimineralis]AZS17405.1 hypothetical protein EI981_25270 [Paenibacillus lutimineralis]
MARMSTQEEVKQSILDLRKIYSELSDERFAARYSKKYRVPVSAVMGVLEQSGGVSHGADRTV